MKYIIVVNDEERIANGDESDLDDVDYEVSELLRSGYFEVESVKVLSV